MTVLATPPVVAERVTEVATDGLVVVTWNVASSCPLGMVTVAGKEATDALEEDSSTTTSTVLTFAIFTVPRGKEPPFTLTDESVKDDTAGASTFSFPDPVSRLAVPVIVAS